MPSVALAARDTTLAQRMTIAAVAAAFPDSDYVANFVSPLAYLLNHRGVTHSLILLPAWAWLLALLAGWAFRHPRGWRPYWGLAAMGLAAHITGDLITSYGTMVFAPLSDTRYAWGTTFIIDLWFSGIIAAGLLLSAACKRSRLPAAGACAALVAYVLFQAALKSQAVDFGVREAKAAGIEDSRVSVQPAPVSPYNWMVVIQKASEYRYTLVNLARTQALSAPGQDGGFFYRLNAPFKPLSDASWTMASLSGPPGDAALAREAWEHPGLAFFRWFAEYPALYRVERAERSTCAWFYDLRFLRPGSDAVPFRFGACRESGGPWRSFRLIDGDVRDPLD
jgi:inner membrane protein